MDFENVQNVEGIIIANSVTNPIERENGKTKQIRSMVTFNDGFT